MTTAHRHAASAGTPCSAARPLWRAFSPSVPRAVCAAPQVMCGSIGTPTATVSLRGPDGVVRRAAGMGTGPVDAAYMVRVLFVRDLKSPVALHTALLLCRLPRGRLCLHSLALHGATRALGACAAPLGSVEARRPLAAASAALLAPLRARHCRNYCRNRPPSPCSKAPPTIPPSPVPTLTGHRVPVPREVQAAGLQRVQHHRGGCCMHSKRGVRGPWVLQAAAAARGCAHTPCAAVCPALPLPAPTHTWRCRASMRWCAPASPSSLHRRSWRAAGWSQ